MPENFAKEAMKIISSPSVQAWITSWIGWLAHYLYVVSKWEHFKLWIFTINVFLAYWLWTVAFHFYPENGWIMAIIGFSSYPTLQILERKGTELVTKIFK